MANPDKLISTKKFQVKPNSKVDLTRVATKPDQKLSKQESEVLLGASRKELAKIQDELYAHNQYSVLIIFQAMDAAGKDGAVKHIMSGFNPLGVKVTSFKAPSSHELDHDFFWRHYLALPARGEIAIHNRSHYENVLITKVHPEYILGESIPGVESLKNIDKEFWEDRYKQIVRFEKNLTQNGTIIMKFFLHISKEEQKKRFLERIDDPTKNWKFSMGDLKERGFWDEYQRAYEEAMSHTSKDSAPWYIIPADDKGFARLAIATVIEKEFSKLSLSYPIVSDEQKAELQKARLQLIGEEDEPKKKKKPKKK